MQADLFVSAGFDKACREWIMYELTIKWAPAPVGRSGRKKKARLSLKFMRPEGNVFRVAGVCWLSNLCSSIYSATSWNVYCKDSHLHEQHVITSTEARNSAAVFVFTATHRSTQTYKNSHWLNSDSVTLPMLNNWYSILTATEATFIFYGRLESCSICPSTSVCPSQRHGRLFLVWCLVVWSAQQSQRSYALTERCKAFVEREIKHRPGQQKTFSAAPGPDRGH